MSMQTKDKLFIVAVAMLAGLVCIFLLYKFQVHNNEEVNEMLQNYVQRLRHKPAESAEQMTEESDATNIEDPSTALGTDDLSASFDTESWQTYRNEEYGFEIGFKELWEGYEAAVQKYDNDTTICFTIKDTPIVRPYCLLQVHIFTFDQWENKTTNLQADQSSQTFRYVFDYNTVCTEENDFQCDRLREVPEIVNTFKFIE